MPAQNFNLKLEPYSSLINQLPRYDFSFQKLQTSQDVKKQFSENYNNQQLIQFNNYRRGDIIRALKIWGPKLNRP